MFKPTLKKILSSFEKTISQLEDLQTRNLSTVDSNKTVIEQIITDNAELTTEAESAKRVAAKLRELLA